MEDSDKQKVQFSDVTLPRYPLTLALPHLITKAIVFSAIIQCIQFFFSHWNIRYICLVQIFDPFNKICIITITNFTNNRSICCNRKSHLSLKLDWDSKNHVRPLYNDLYTLMKKYRHNTRKHKVHLWNSLRGYSWTLWQMLRSCWLAGAMLPPHGLKHTLQIYISEKGQLAQVLLHNLSSSDGDL